MRKQILLAISEPDEWLARGISHEALIAAELAAQMPPEMILRIDLGRAPAAPGLSYGQTNGPAPLRGHE